MGSTEGLATIKAAGGIVDVTSGQPWDTLKGDHPITAEDNSSLTLKFGGSDSVCFRRFSFRNIVFLLLGLSEGGGRES